VATTKAARRETAISRRCATRDPRPTVTHHDTRADEQARRRTTASVAVATAFARELLDLRPMRALVVHAHGQKQAVMKLSRLRVLACVLTVSGCAGSAPQPETRSEPVRTPAQMCHVDRALLIPARAPDCGFARAELKTVDPEQWAHLKLEFERKCYQTAEKAVRERLRRLQAAARCEVASAER